MKRVRQYIGILAAVAAYYSVHEGAHLLCAVFLGTFRQIRFMGIGMQVDVYAERMSGGEMALFCIAEASGQYLYPKTGYDLCVDSSESSPAILAEKIINSMA
jgi:hypothetical protein